MPAGSHPQAQNSLSDQRFADLFQPAVQPRPGLVGEVVRPEAQPAAKWAGGAGQPQALPVEVQAAPPVADSFAAPVVATSSLPTAPPTPATHAQPVLTLPSGLEVPEQAVLEQVVGHLQLRTSNGPQRLTLRLNPEELGEVRLELIVEKETVRAHLQAQTQQVQEVLEKHLHRLRESFEQQGLKLQEFQVSVDSGRDGGRGFFDHARQQAQTPPAWGSERRQPAPVSVEPAPIAAARPSHGGALSLRV